jgi:hypothetical protein
MFIGHFGIGFAAKRIAPKASLGTLFFASQFIDLLWPILLLLGIEQVKIDPGNTVVTPLEFTHYPYSHSFLTVVIWALLLGITYFIVKRNKALSLYLGAIVLSHWLLDLIVHRPDLPLIPWLEIKTGFGLWNSLSGTIIVEGMIFISGVFFYVKTTNALNKKGIYGLWGLVLVLIILYISNLFGPLPPSTEAIAYSGLLQWLFILLAFWIDRNRKTVA